MSVTRPSYKKLIVNGLELFGLFALSALISWYFPHWVPKATVDPTQREWASVFSAGAMLACVISLRALSMIPKTRDLTSSRGSTSSASSLKWASIAVDAMAFLWSTRACTDRDTMIVTVVMGIAYLGFPKVLKRLTGTPASSVAYPDDAAVARIVAVAAGLGLICVLISGAITEV